MVNIELLKEKISRSGMTMVAISRKAGITRGTMYNRISGKSDFTASEIVALTDVLSMTKEERDIIFLS